MPNSRESVKAILTEAEKIQEAQKRIEALEQSNTQRLRALVTAVVIDVLLTLGVTYLYIHQRQNTQSIHKACVQRNQSNAANKEVWGFVLSASKGADPALINRFQDELNRAYPIREC